MILSVLFGSVSCGILYVVKWLVLIVCEVCQLVEVVV